MPICCVRPHVITTSGDDKRALIWDVRLPKVEAILAYEAGGPINQVCSAALIFGHDRRHPRRFTGAGRSPTGSVFASTTSSRSSAFDPYLIEISLNCIEKKRTQISVVFFTLDCLSCALTCCQCASARDPAPRTLAA